MSYVVTFYARDATGADIVVSTHHVLPALIRAYITVPAVVLAAVQTVKGNQRPDSYRIVDEGGFVVLHYDGKKGKGQ